MISPRPGSDPWAVLDLVVRHPGRLDVGMIGERLWRPKVTGTDAYLKVRQQIVQHGAHWQHRAASALHRLQGAGLVERMRAPAVHEDVTVGDLDDAVEAIRAGASGVIDGEPDPSGIRAALLLRLVRSTPATTREWVGTAPTGHLQRAVSDLVAWGLVVPPSYRWPTPAGVRLITGDSA